MGDTKRAGGKVVYEIDGKVMADVRSAEELAECVELYPGYAVVEKVQLSERSRGGIIMPNPDTKDQQHLMLFRVAVAGPQKKDGEGKPLETRAEVDKVVILKPSVAQFLLNQGHRFGVVQDQDIIGTVKLEKAPPPQE